METMDGPFSSGVEPMMISIARRTRQTAGLAVVLCFFLAVPRAASRTTAGEPLLQLGDAIQANRRSVIPGLENLHSVFEFHVRSPPHRPR